MPTSIGGGSGSGAGGGVSPNEWLYLFSGSLDVPDGGGGLAATWLLSQVSSGTAPDQIGFPSWASLNGSNHLDISEPGTYLYQWSVYWPDLAAGLRQFVTDGVVTAVLGDIVNTQAVSATALDAACGSFGTGFQVGSSFFTVDNAHTGPVGFTVSQTSGATMSDVQVIVILQKIS